MEEVKKSWNKSSIEKGLIASLFVRACRALNKLNSVSRILFDYQRRHSISLHTFPLHTSSNILPLLLANVRVESLAIDPERCSVSSAQFFSGAF
jgi:hypothetical protein